MKISENDKRKVPCPFCAAPIGKPCRSARIPGANTFGGGWGGSPDLDKAHAVRRVAFIESHHTPH